MVLGLLSKAYTSVFGSRNDRFIKQYRRRVDQINALESEFRRLTDTELRAQTAQFQAQIKQGARTSDLLPRVMAAAREAMDRAVGIRKIFNPELAFDPQRLPEAVRPLFMETMGRMQATEPIQIHGCAVLTPGWMQVEIPLPIYEAVRALYPRSRPPFRARPFDVQLIGGMVLGEGRIAEMKTGEGKTIVAPLACYVACVESLQCHVVTVNDYLVQRDRDWVFPFYHWLGLSVGAIHPYHMQPPEGKQEAYRCNVVYGTNSEFGFDYLRDNMKLSTQEQVQKRRDFCIIDEVDSILIDEARTPLIISGPAHEDAPRYEAADQVAQHLVQKQREWDAADAKVQQCTMRIKGFEGDIRNSRDKAKADQMREQMKQHMSELPRLEAARDQYTQYYEVEKEKKAAHLTHDGVAEAQRKAGIGSFYVGNNMDFPHLLENALRAHVVYQRDKEYVVQNGEVIIVDEFTGRLMIGRQWSDGLHQAVESKERVKIKEETQTLATVTIQNFFKLYKRLAGMTGTAITEATEFHEIYKLDVVCIPTNVNVVRNDYEDIIYLSQADKWNAILDEIKRHHDIGRPVLVGTTSVENSEMLSAMLTKRDSIRHEVLNAKQHEREAQIVAHAGELGAVMIATNMAGRGTDIVLRPVEREALVRHWQQRNLLSSKANAGMSDDELLNNYHRHMATTVLGISTKDVESLTDADVRLKLLRHWVEADGWRVPWPALKLWEKVLAYKYFLTPPWHDPAKVAGMSEAELVEVLDRLPNFMLHRAAMFKHVEEMGGLHIVGTERHESRRIDNQLRGRAGRQGDRGSSRFFIALDDELMKMFAGKTTLAALSRLGMKEGDAIEHRWLTRSVERAQTKVERRNYEIRKNLLEYDEVMEHQRNAFYGIRQDVLNGHNVDQLVVSYVEDSVGDAVGTYLSRDYVPIQVAEWCRQTLDISLDPGKIHLHDADSLVETIRKEARAEVMQVVDVTLGEYMSNDIPVEDWDLKGLSHWAMSRFSVDLKINQLRQMSVDDVKEKLIQAAVEQVERKDLTDVTKFVDPLYGLKELAGWVKEKCGVELQVESFEGMESPQVTERVTEQVLKAYRRREVTYPADFAIDMTFAAARHDAEWAAGQLVRWAYTRYGIEWEPDQIKTMSGAELHEKLTSEAEEWIHGDRMAKLVEEALRDHKEPAALSQWAADRLGVNVTVEDLQAGDRRQVLLEAGRSMLRSEMTSLERFILLQMLDSTWKDHLYTMDQIKDSVGLRGYAEKDPRIEYKREGGRQFHEMQKTVRDRVTDLIFRARLTPEVQARNVYAETEARHDVAAPSTAVQATAQQRADLDAAERAGGGDEDDSQLTRRQRRAKAHRSEPPAAKPAAADRGFKKRRKR